MTRKIFLLGAALITASFSIPAQAGRGIQIDVDARAAPICALNDPNCAPWEDFRFFGDGPFKNLYIYQEGVISFGTPIASLSNAVFSVARSSQRFTVLTGVTTIGDERISLINYFDPGDLERPLFQYQLRLLDPGAFELGYAHRTAPAGATIGYRVGEGSGSVTNANGLLLGENSGDSRFEFVLFNDLPNGEPGLGAVTFEPRRSVALIPGIPEPATWAMLIMGFGVVGGAMRKRHDLVNATA